MLSTGYSKDPSCYLLYFYNKTKIIDEVSLGFYIKVISKLSLDTAVSEQGYVIQWTQSRELSELRKSTKFHLYN